MKKALISFASRGTHFATMQKRLAKTAMEQGFDGDYLFFNNEAQLVGCPPHSEVPYAFKAYALQEAKKRGYELVLWADSSISIIRPWAYIEHQIVKDGYLFMASGFNSGEWCSDAALKTLGITREESFNYPHLMACCMGFDLREPAAKAFLKRYLELAGDGVTFKGAYTNNNHEVSTDDRVRGHRHDQTAASIIACKLGMENWLKHWLVYDEGEQDKSTWPETLAFTLRHGL